MIKVCHMTSAHEEEDIRIFRKECVSLAEAGYDVYLVERGESYEKNGVHIVGVGEIPAGRLKRMTQGAKKVYAAAKALDADIYHFHDPELLPYGLKLKKAGKKVIFDSHEMYTEQIREKPYLPHWFARLLSHAYGKYESHVLGRIDGLVYTCLKDGVHPFAGKCRHITTIDNTPMLWELYDRYDESVPKEPRSVVYVGGLSYARGITHLIRAAASCDCTLYLAGMFDSEEYRQSVEAMPEFSCVKYLGLIGREQVAALIQRACVGAATLLNVGQYNQDDNLATKVYEYMSMSVPVLLTHSTYNDRVMERFRFGLCVDPENVDETADAIRYLLDHPDEARQLGENGRRAVKEELNWGVEEKKLLALYDEILNEK